MSQKSMRLRACGAPQGARRGAADPAEPVKDFAPRGAPPPSGVCECAQVGRRPVAQNKMREAGRVTRRGDKLARLSTMRTAGPAAGAPLPVLEVLAAPGDPARSGLRLLGRRDPADPFVARERRDVLPCRQRLGVGYEGLFQVRGQVVDHAAWDLSCALDRHSVRSTIVVSQRIIERR